MLNMKTSILCAVLLCLSTCLSAQPHSAMKFAGPSTFGVAAMDAWQENETDTILFLMTSGSEADITLPALTYNALDYTIPSFTIHGATFAFNMSTHNAEFAEQEFSETFTVDGEEKTSTGTLTATYDGSARQFRLTVVMSYGRMPLPVTYSLTADYVTPATAIRTVGADIQSSADAHPVYNIIGQPIATAQRGINIIGGRKVLVK